MRRYIVGALIFLFGAFSSLIVSYGSKLRQFDFKIAEVTKEAPSTSINMLDAKKNGERVLVTRVIDGDTIELADGRRARYIGIDTPEYNVFTPRPTRAHTEPFVECFGKQARAENQQLVEGKYVRLEQDVSDKDQYGRLLRYVFVGDVFVNDHLVRQGFARVAAVPSDIAHQKQFLATEREAREQKRGMWNQCY